MNRGFDPNVVSSIDALINRAQFPYVQYPIRGGLRFAGQDGLPRTAADPYFKTFQPRIGLAYALGRKTVIRGGWGRYYINPNNDFLQSSGYNASTALNVSGDSNRTALPNLLSDPFPVITQPVGNTKGLMTFVGNGFNFINTHFEIPHVEQFSAELQHAVTSRARVTLSYVGNRGRRLQGTKTFNDEDDSSIRNQC